MKIDLTGFTPEKGTDFCGHCGGDPSDCRAVVAVGPRWSGVIWGTTHMLCDLREAGLDAEDIFNTEGLAQGLHVWEGRIEGYQSNHPLDPVEYDVDYVGEFRPLTDREWDALRSGVSPFDVEMCEWCGAPVLDGRTHGDGQCFNIRSPLHCPRCDSTDMQSAESIFDEHMCRACGHTVEVDR